MTIQEQLDAVLQGRDLIHWRDLLTEVTHALECLKGVQNQPLIGGAVR